MVKLKHITQANVEDILNGNATPAFSIRGKLGRGSGYGFSRYGNGLFGRATGPGGIYQRRNTGYNQRGYIPGLPKKTYYVRMRTYRPTNPRTELQQANRGSFADAVAAWQAMPDEERKVWRDRAARKSRRGRNLFIQEYMLQSGP